MASARIVRTQSEQPVVRIKTVERFNFNESNQLTET